MRFYMGVGKYRPDMSLYGDMGWKPCIIKQWSCIFRMWSRFTKMCNNRLNKKVFLWANRCCSNRIKNWNFRVHSKFREFNVNHFCNTDFIFNKSSIKMLENIYFEKFKDNWLHDLNYNNRSKLRTYRIFKQEYGVEKYLQTNMPGRYRSAFSKFRCGVAPLKIETGRYEGILSENRFCFNDICRDNSTIEDEKHVVLHCPLYSHLREDVFTRARSFYDGFTHLTDDNKFIFLFSNESMFFYSSKISHDI